MSSYDAAIVGGGPAGAIAAYVLARAGRRVVLIDGSAGLALRTVGESLPAIAGHLLRKIGLDAVLEGHRSSFGNVSAWGDEALVSTDFIQDPHGLGWHLDRARFDRELRAAASEAGATLVSGRVRTTACSRGWTLGLEDSTSIEAACVMDATGRRASIAKRSGARRVRDDGLIALYAWARGADAEDERTLVESVPDGWWYTAPLPARERVVVLHVDGADAHRARREFAERLAATKHVRAVVSLAKDARPRAVEACGARLDAFVGRGWVAIGDAALSFDPIAAQGIFNALYTGMKAGEAVDTALRGDASGLSAYTRRLDEIRAAYVERHVHAYELEQRFAGSPFWNRRHG